VVDFLYELTAPHVARAQVKAALSEAKEKAGDMAETVKDKAKGAAEDLGTSSSYATLRIIPNWDL
jgi:hypothetical protein